MFSDSTPTRSLFSASDNMPDMLLDMNLADFARYVTFADMSSLKKHFK